MDMPAEEDGAQGLHIDPILYDEACSLILRPYRRRLLLHYGGFWITLAALFIGMAKAGPDRIVNIVVFGLILFPGWRWFQRSATKRALPQIQAIEYNPTAVRNLAQRLQGSSDRRAGFHNRLLESDHLILIHLTAEEASRYAVPDEASQNGPALVLLEKRWVDPIDG